MSDILSVLETRELDGENNIKTDALIPKDYCLDSDGRNDYGEMSFPSNLYIVGTVNMDETTFQFSRKVLDRANTIEFSYVDLLSMPSFGAEIPARNEVTNRFLQSSYVTLNNCEIKARDYITGICTYLARINSVLRKADAHIGYRVRDEIVFYMLYNRKFDLLDEKTAFDNQIMQKILPGIHGSGESVKAMLEELKKLFESEKYEASTQKIGFMLKRYEEDGFTSYWL